MRSILNRSLIAALFLGVTAHSLMAQTRIELINFNTTWKYNQSGTDLGTSWRTAGFNDSAWLSGPGVLGFPQNEALLGVSTVATVLERFIPGTNPQRQVTNYYFRVKFQWTENAQGATLVATNLIDDGAIFYLNNVEVGRVAMPAGAVNFQTFSTRADDISAHGVETMTFPASALVQGENILAVEVHQGGETSSDIIMGMRLRADLPAAGPAQITTEPVSQATTIGSPVTFTVSVAGTPPYNFQWRKNGNNIAGATGQSYTISNPNLGDAGNYSVVVSNATGSDTSADAILTVSSPPIQLIAFNKTWRFHDGSMDLGTAWRAVNFDDSAWKTGPGPFGFEEAAIPVPVATAMVDNDQITYYLRTTFQFTNDPLDVQLTFTNEVDDGMVIYINNTEVLRVGMSPGAVAYATAAGRTVGDAALETAIVPAEALVKGVNTIAVEAHQVNTTSSDIVMGLALAANFLPPSPISITNQPDDLVIEELKPATFEVGITGNSPRYQWFKDGALIAGANSRQFTIPSVALADQGVYTVLVSNVVNQVLSTGARLTVLADTNGPVLLSADGTTAPTAIIVSYNEPVQAMAATNTANYVVSNATAGAILAISRAVLTNATNVVLTTDARATEQNYILFARNIIDINPRQNMIAPNSAVPVTSLLRVIRDTENWDFYDPVPGFDPPITDDRWKGFNFDPVAEFWGNGPGGFVYDLNNQDLPIQRGTILSQGSITKYFRKLFDFKGSPAGATLTLRHVVDDGAVFYLNGTELFRYNMPAGPITNSTLSDATIGVATFVETNVPANLLRFGQNLLAVELHGRAGNDQDWVYALDLQARIDSYATGAVVIARQPRSQTIIEGQTAIFDFRGVGAGRFQWQRDNVDIPGATNATYTILSVPMSLNGSTYRVIASNTTSSRTSSNATLTVINDTVRPELVSAFGVGSQVTVTFTEQLNQTSAQTVGNYQITNSAGGVRAISNARLTNGNVVVITTGTPAQVGDVLIVNGVTDNSSAQNAILANSAVTIGFESLLIAMDGAWKFNASNTDLGTAWRDLAFNDASWTNGSALFGEESASIPGIVRTAIPAPANSSGLITTYYRTHFNFPGSPTGVSLILNTIIDDGAVFFLNGQEIHRLGVPAGETFTTVANRTVGDAVLEGPFTLPVPSLRSGDNVLAVSHHESAATSSDRVFGADLSMAPVPSRVIPPDEGGEYTLAITQLGNGMVRVDWSGDGWVLEQTSSFSGASITWNSVPGQPKPYTFTPATGGQVFFRLRK